jgi:ATP-dependent Clp protease ATP-binding subunit ClpA
VFRPLGAPELHRILSIELNMLQQRIFNSSGTTPFVFKVTEEARDYLLREGTDMKYGARHLKRAIDRALVHPMSNLIASDQIRGGDLIQVDFDAELQCLAFVKQAEDLAAYAMIQMVDTSLTPPPAMNSASAEIEYPRVANAKSQRTR